MANITVRMTPAVEKYIGETKNKSQKANYAIEAWIASEKEARRSLKGLFTAPELCALIDILNATIIDVAHANSLRYEFEDACSLDGMDSKWGLDKASTLAKMDALTMPQWIVLAQWAAAFWDDTDRSVESYAAQLA